MYKKAVKCYQTVKCKFFDDKDYYTISVKSIDESDLHAIIKLYKNK
jgi:hypothetical protein